MTEIVGCAGQEHVVLGGVSFDTDPQVYEPFTWEKRATVNPGIGGSMTVQDFGTFKKDDVVHLGSGQTGFLTLSTVKSLLGLYATKGAAFVFTDWLGNAFSVFILDFKPEPAQVGDLFRYDMTLQVLDITTLLGDAYTGD